MSEGEGRVTSWQGGRKVSPPPHLKSGDTTGCWLVDIFSNTEHQVGLSGWFLFGAESFLLVFYCSLQVSLGEIL